MAKDSYDAWQRTVVSSPQLSEPVPVLLARGIPYLQDGNRLQTLNIYIPSLNESESLVGEPVSRLPNSGSKSGRPHWQVHIHGGAWRDPDLSATSIEATVAHTFSAAQPSVDAIISINYTLSPFPTHPTKPYDLTEHRGQDPAREARHPIHVQDILHAFSFLRSLGLTDDTYILTGHSAGACLAFQATLRTSQSWGVDGLPNPPRPAALLGFNGLYDLPGLVHSLGISHAHLEDVYADLLSIAFGPDERDWKVASPAAIDTATLSHRVRDGSAPRLVLVDQSAEDQLVPINQAHTMMARLEKIVGLKVLKGGRATGEHAAPWKQGYIISDTVEDVLDELAMMSEDAGM